MIEKGRNFRINTTGAHFIFSGNEFYLAIVLQGITERDITAFSTETPKLRFIVGNELFGCSLIVLIDDYHVSDDIEPLLASGDIDFTKMNKRDLKELIEIEDGQDIPVEIQLFDFYQSTKPKSSRRMLIPSEAVMKLRDVARKQCSKPNESHIRNHEAFGLRFKIPNLLEYMEESNRKDSEFGFTLK